MRDFQRKRGLRNFFESWPVLAVLTILLLFFAWGVIGFIGKMQTTRQNRIIAENKITELRQEKEKLSYDIEKLETDGGVEATIREKFGLAKEGEGLIVVVEDKNTAEAPKEDTGGFFSFFTNWFK